MVLPRPRISSQRSCEESGTGCGTSRTTGSGCCSTPASNGTLDQLLESEVAAHASSRRATKWPDQLTLLIPRWWDRDPHGPPGAPGQGLPELGCRSTWNSACYS